MSRVYRHPALRQLMDQQSRTATRERRLEQLDRAEQLLAEIEAQRRYPIEFLCYRITGYRADSSSLLALPGPDVRHDLQLFVEDLSRTVGQPIDEASEAVLTVEEVGRRYNVSTRTVNRWRRQGLVARRFLVSGRVKVGFLESSLTRFVSEHREQVDRGTRFSQLSEAEREEIVRRARRLASVRQVSLSEIARRIARKMSRSPETIRMTLKTYDRQHPDRADLSALDRPSGRGGEGPDLPDAHHRHLGRRPGQAIRPNPIEHLPDPQRVARHAGCWKRSWSSCTTPASTSRPRPPRSSAPCPSRPAAGPLAR